MHNKAVLFSKIKSSCLRLFFALLAHCSVLCGSCCSHFTFLKQRDILFQLSFGIVYFLLFVSVLLLQLIKFGMKLKKKQLSLYIFKRKLWTYLFRYIESYLAIWSWEKIAVRVYLFIYLFLYIECKTVHKTLPGPYYFSV